MNNTEKCLKIFCAILLSGFLAFSLLLCAAGIALMHQEKLLSDDLKSTQETCIILSTFMDECTDTNKDTSSRHLDHGRYGTLYDFEAIASNKCGNQTLLYYEYEKCNIKDEDFLMDIEIGSNHTCFVLNNCDQFSFRSFNDYFHESPISGNITLSLGIGLLLCVICCILYMKGHCISPLPNDKDLTRIRVRSLSHGSSSASSSSDSDD